MAGYVIYIPGGRGYSPEQLDAVGLAGLREGSIELAEALPGPDGNNGVIVAWSHPGKPTVFDADRFTWHPAVPEGELAAGRYFMGLPNEGVCPADIVRKETYPGWFVPLFAGHKWNIPAAAQLPHRHALDAQGQHTRKIVERFQAYWDQSQQYAAQIFAAADQLLAAAAETGQDPGELTTKFTLADTWNFCVTALSINYRLNADLVSLLGGLDDNQMANICKAAADLPTLVRIETQKKTESVTIPVGLSI